MNLDLENHRREFPHVAFEESNGVIYGWWVIGNVYTNDSAYYGAYPKSYVERVRSLFPKQKKILHLFSGSIKADRHNLTVDVNPRLKPVFLTHAESMSEFIPENSQKLILADPPYSPEHAEKYGTKMPNVPKVLKECYKILKPGGVLVWLSTRAPMYSSKQFERIALFGLYISSNHLYRGVAFFRKKGV